MRRRETIDHILTSWEMEIPLSQELISLICLGAPPLYRTKAGILSVIRVYVDEHSENLHLHGRRRPQALGF